MSSIPHPEAKRLVREFFVRKKEVTATTALIEIMNKVYAMGAASKEPTTTGAAALA